MPKYIALYQFTDQGIKNFDTSVQRARAAIAAAEQMGGKALAIYWTLGPYDVVSVGEFPDDETATAFSLKIGSLGNVRATTLRAFDESEMTKIVAKAK
jgi:uncharacterized protein with GYD domain